jgi:hypothetical protein
VKTSVHSPVRRSSKFVTLIISGLIVLLGIWPALYNHFPLYYPDSGFYVTGLWTETPPQIPLGLYVLIASVLVYYGGPFSLVIFHSIASFLVVASFFWRWLGTLSVALLLATGFILSFTRLAWVNSLLMPDVFGGLGPAAVITLMIGNFALSPFYQLFLLGVVSISLLSQTSSLAIIPACAAFIGSVSWGLGVKVNSFRPIVAVCMLCFAAVGITNLVKYGQFSANPSGPANIFAKFVESGLAQKYLSENCNKVDYRICSRLETLNRVAGPLQRFLWEGVDGDRSLADQTDAWLDPNNEFRELAFRLVAAYPFEFLKMSIRDTFELLQAPGEEFTNKKGWWWFYLHWAKNFDAARQQNDTLVQREFNEIYAIVYFASLLSLGILAIVSRSPTIKCLCLSTLFLSFTNALVHAALVCACYRYQDKVSWLPLMSLIAIAMSRARRIDLSSGAGTRSHA